MKKTLLHVLGTFAFGFGLLVPSAQASHIEGTDITYQRVGPYQYLVTLKVYRDCSGIPVTPTVPIEVIPSGCPAGQTFTTTLSNTGVFTEVSDVAPGQATTCSTPPNNSVHGVQEYTYSGMITVPASACATEWAFSYVDCCRNTTVNLNQFGSNIYFYTQASVLADTSIANNSPLYSANPVPYVCVMDTVTYMAQATDPDGDSLVFTLVPAKGSSNLPLYYNTGYSGSQPFGAGSPLQLDPATGFLRVIPNALGDYVVVLQVDEYRTINGQVRRVGTSQRDVQYHVVQCTTALPRLAGNLNVTSGSMNQTVAPTSVIQAGAGQPITISLPTYSATPGVTLTLTSNSDNEIPGSTFTVNTSGAFPVGVFTWTPTAQHVRATPYTFSYNLSDNGTPIPNEVYGVVKVQVTSVLSASAEVTNSLLLPNVIAPEAGQAFAVPGAAPGDFALSIYDPVGRLVYSSARYNNQWNGSQVAGGLYLYRLLDNRSGQVYQGQLAVVR